MNFTECENYIIAEIELNHKNEVQLGSLIQDMSENFSIDQTGTIDILIPVLRRLIYRGKISVNRDSERQILSSKIENTNLINQIMISQNQL